MLQAGDKVGRFVVEHVLGEGGMGIVYQAHDEHLGRKVALKVVATTGDAEASARVLREARVIAALDHPNAVIIHEGGEINGEPYIAMELVPGQNLRSFVDKPDLLATRKVRWLVEVARVLAAAHKAGIVHRDVKPENVMVRPDGRIKVLDFGIARRSASSVDAVGPTAKAFIPTVTSSGGFVGTPMYMAPELLKGKPADGRSDQFSWAVLA
jgi:serine/threonine-protein kinase